jgi:ABC-type nitrate/sulfonate/bicarbonate transport system substrate-binding protein
MDVAVAVGTGRGRRRRWAGAAGTLVLLLAAAVPPAAAPAEGPPERLRVAYAAIGGSMANLWVAKESGAFAKHGLDVELIYLGSGPKAMAGLIAGDTPFVQGSGEAMVVARLAGRDVVGIAETIHTFVFSLMVSPAIAGPEDLRGKVLGMTKAGSSTDFALRVALRRLGLQPGRDVQVLAVGGIPEILAGIEGGKLHGGILSPPSSPWPSAAACANCWTFPRSASRSSRRGSWPRGRTSRRTPRPRGSSCEATWRGSP